MEIRLLRPSDDRSRFRSGVLDLDRFFQKYAGQNQFHHHIGTTYVALEEGQIRGFTTIAPGHIEVERLAPAHRKKLPSYPAPILRLARLAVEEASQGRGVGKQLLRFVLLLSIRMAEDFGCIGIVVDAKPAAVSFYSSFGFMPLDVIEGQSPIRPQPTAMFLPLNDVRACL